MKLSYYDKFRCTADKCEITCCQEWKISVDDKTIVKWEKMGFSDCICEKDEEIVIKLNEDRKCPFLSDNKLCGLVVKYGEELIPHTCDIFPRQTHQFENRTEYALVSCCPEVINLLDVTDINEMTLELLSGDYDYMYRLRNLIIKEIVDSESSVMALKKSFFMMLDCVNKNEERENKTIKAGKHIGVAVSEDVFDNSVTEYADLNIYNTAYFNELESAIEKIPVNLADTLEEVNELFLDIVENYRKQGIYVSYIEKIAALAEDISEKMSEGSESEHILHKYTEYPDEINRFDNIFKKYLISELFADGLLSDSNPYELTIMLQWFAIEYALIKHAVFLKMLDENRKPEFSDISVYMVIISRIMGYNKEDIYEYMEECFKESIWEWGYFSLVVG